MAPTQVGLLLNLSLIEPKFYSYRFQYQIPVEPNEVKFLEFKFSSSKYSLTLITMIFQLLTSFLDFDSTIVPMQTMLVQVFVFYP